MPPLHCERRTRPISCESELSPGWLVQVARSVPGVVSVVTGQSAVKHVTANTAVLEFPLLTKSQLNSVYRARTFEQRFGEQEDDR